MGRKFEQEAGVFIPLKLLKARTGLPGISYLSLLTTCGVWNAFKGWCDSPRNFPLSIL